MINSTLFVLAVFVLLLVVGSIAESGPSAEVLEADRRPTTTTTTEPPPEGVAFVQISNGVFSPAILKVDLTEIQIVRWTNEDELEYLLTSTAKAWEPVTLAQGDQFEFDFSTLDPAIHRYNATVGFNRIPGSIDTRPDQ